MQVVGTQRILILENLAKEDMLYTVSYAIALGRGPATAAQRFLDQRLQELVAGGRPGRSPRDVPLTELIYRSMLDHPSNMRMINGATGESFTNAQILRSSVRLSRWLLSLLPRGTGADNRPVLLCVMRNTEHLVTLYYAALFAGVQVFLLDPHSTHTELVHFLPLVEPSLVACDADRLLEVTRAVQAAGQARPPPVVAHDELGRQGGAHCDDPTSFQPVDVAPTSCAVLLPTSGSTGLPKVAEITLEGLQAQLPSIWSGHSQFPRPTERAMFMSTAQWMTFTNMLTSCPVYNVTIVISPDKTLPTILHILEACKPTWVLLGPGSAAELAESAHAQHLTSLQRALVTGAAPAPAALRRLAALASSAAVLNSYGMTETMGFAAIADDDAPFNTIGKIFNIFQYKLVDDDGKEVARGERGELYLKGDWIIKRYVKNEAAHQECATADGWWRTGDVFTEDEHNYLFFVERKRFWFKYLNYHISPEELERVISGVAGVQEVVVGGTERGAAAAVVCGAGGVAREDIHRAVDSTLSDYKRLRGGVAFVNSLPHTHSGKLHRADCARLLQQLADSGECF